MTDKKPPGPVRRALFQDVPYILDSLWRRYEFRLHRIGVVDFTAPHGLTLRSPWRTVTFLLYAAVCLFAVFGPTLDALCSVTGSGFVSQLRVFAGVALIVASVFAILYVLNDTTWHLTRKGEELADESCRKDPKKAELRQKINHMLEKDADKLARLRALLGALLGRFFANATRLFVAGLFIRGWDRVALILAFGTLFIGSVLLIGPVLVTGLALRYAEFDPASCMQAPNRDLVYAQLAAFAILIAGGWFIWKRWAARSAFGVFCASTALLAAVIAVLWLAFTSEKPTEATGGFYPHVYLVVLAILLGMALLAKGFARFMFRDYEMTSCEQFRDALAGEDLLHNLREPPDVSWLRLLSAFVTGVFGHLLHFLLLPAYVAFVVPSTWLIPSVIGAAVVSAGLLTYGSLSKRWEQMLIHVDRWFLVGTPLVVSIFVIIIAICRLMNVQYVTTVLDATPTGVLFVIIVMMYAAVWFFEYWINRWLGDELLGILGERAQSRRGFLPIAFKPDPLCPCPWAEESGRYLAVHSMGRFCAQGWFTRKTPAQGEAAQGLAFTTYGLAELFGALAVRQYKGAELSRDIERRILLYFNTINVLLVIAVFVCIGLARPKPLAVTSMVNVQEVSAKAAGAAPPVDALGERLKAQAAQDRPSLVIAASGGGTRAAVYTAVALEGVARLERARDVVLLSGVSGGGVSAAVFASRFGALTQTAPGAALPKGESNPWDDYVGVVSAPYIQDVLEGMGELRIAGSESLGTLLQESLEARAFKDRVRTLGDLAQPGLILNTTITGHPYDDSQLMGGRVATPRDNGDCLETARPYANLAGGRLVFTNLRNVSGFPQKPETSYDDLPEDPPDMWLPYSIVNVDAVPLAAASALTANFPPVFSNARVRLTSDAAETDPKKKCPRSYFVTDGGATENLGLVSALYALKGTLGELGPGDRISDIHLLALEASAIDYDYSDDRGIGAATGGSKERINAGLTQMLLAEVRGLVKARGARLHVHYLPLPVAFRSRGGFGTHWMFAPEITLANPHLASLPDDPLFARGSTHDFVVLDRKEVMSTMRAMFDRAEPICERAERVHTKPETAALDYENGWSVDVQHVARWICGFDDHRGTRAPRADWQVDAWKKVVADLSLAN